MSFKCFSIFSFCGHCAQRGGIILAILVGGYPRNVSVELFRNRVIGRGGDLV